MQFDDSRILGIELQSNNFTLLFLTVYLPYECDKFYDDYCFYLSKLQCIIDSANTPYVFILGDFNADIQNTSIFGAELLDFCDNNTLCFLDKEFLPPDSFIYISEAHGTTSWLDYCITTTSGKSITSGVSIIDDIVCSDHFPLCIDIVCDINPLSDTVADVNYQPKIKWHAASEFDKQQYSISTGKFASTVSLPRDALLCKNPKCTIHHNDIDCFYSAIISAIKISASHCIPSSTASTIPYNIVPGWNEYVKEHHLHAKDALWWWNLNNKPRNGPIYQAMRTTRAHFKYALRFVKKQEDTARADSLARDLYDKDVDGFWNAVHKMNACNNVQANVIYGITGQDRIANYWKEHFYKILNANDCDPNLTAGIARKLQNVQHDSNMAVSAKSITEIVSKLECAKSAGPDGIIAECFKFSDTKIHVLLSLLFSMCLSLVSTFCTY